MKPSDRVPIPDLKNDNTTYGQGKGGNNPPLMPHPAYQPAGPPAGSGGSGIAQPGEPDKPPAQKKVSQSPSPTIDAQSTQLWPEKSY